MSEPSPVRQHLIDFAAKRDWKGLMEFLPIFGDWLDERGEPEAMACRAGWKLVEAFDRLDLTLRTWHVPLPDWCSQWRDLLETSAIPRLHGCVNQRWFLHCAPGTLRYFLWHPFKFYCFYEIPHATRLAMLHQERLDRLIVPLGFAALFWPPGTFAQQSNRGEGGRPAG